MAMHMLYHVPEPETAVNELRRITRPGGKVLVVLNGADHLRELHELVVSARTAAGEAIVPSTDRLRLDDGLALLRTGFSNVERHDFLAELVLTDAQPVLDCVASTIPMRLAEDPNLMLAALGEHLRQILAQEKAPRVRTHSGCLVAY